MVEVSYEEVDFPLKLAGSGEQRDEQVLELVKEVANVARD